MEDPTLTLTDLAKDEFIEEYPTLRYFTYGHLPTHLGAVAAQFHDLAWLMTLSPDADDNDPRETAAGLRKLLEAKDCFVRARLRKS